MWHNLGGIRHAQGDLDAAEQFARRGLTISIAALGDDHLTVAADRAALAAILADRGDDDEAEALLHQALAVFTSRLGADHYEVAVVTP